MRLSTLQIVGKQDLASILLRVYICFNSLGGSSKGVSRNFLLFFWSVLVQLHEFGKIELWLLEDLDLSNHAVVFEWEDLVALLLDFFANLFFNAIKYKYY